MNKVFAWSLAIWTACFSLWAEEPYDELVEAIYIPSTAYFQTGYAVTNQPRVTMVFGALALSGEGDIFGSSPAQNGCFILNVDTDRFFLRYGLAASSSGGAGSFSEYQRLEMVCDKTLTVNGKEFFTAATTGSFANNTCVMCFPGRRNHGRDFLVSSFKLEDGDVIICDMVACRKNGVLGFYDKVNDKFVTMSGTGTLSVAHYASTCTWTGGANTSRLGDEGNWDRPPYSSFDTIVIPCDDNPVISNEVARTFKAIYFTGSGNAQLQGETLTLSGAGKVWTNCINAMVTCRLPLAFTSSSSVEMDFRDAASFYEEVSYTGTGSFVLQACLGLKASNRCIGFYAPLNAPKATVMPQSTGALPFYFYDSLRAKKLYNNTTECNSGYNWIYAPMAYSGMQVSYRHYNLMLPDVLCPTVNVEWVGYAGGGRIHVYRDQVCGALISPETAHASSCTATGDNRVLNICDKSVFTLRPTGTATTSTTYNVVYGDGTLNYAPLDSTYVQTFAARTNGFSGTLVVSNGTLRLTAGSCWKNLKRLIVWKTGRLEIDEANGVENPFPALDAILMEAGAKLALPSTVCLTAATVYYNGQRLGEDTYSTADWIEAVGSAAGSVKVQYAGGQVDWASNAASGDWSVPSNWVQLSIPDAQTKAFVTLDGAMSPQTVTVATDAVNATNLTACCESPFGGSLQFDVSALWPFTRAWLAFGSRTTVVLKENGTLWVDDLRHATADANTDARIVFKDGAKLTVEAGGTFCYTNMQGRVVFEGAGADGTPSGLEVKALGVFACVPGCKEVPLVVKDGAKIDVAGLLVLGQTNKTSSSLLLQSKGDILVHDSGVIKVDNVSGVTYGSVTFGSGTTRLTDDAKVWSYRATGVSSTFAVQPTLEDEPAEFIFEGRSSVTGSFGRISIGGAKGLARVKVVDESTLQASGMSVWNMKVGQSYGRSYLELAHGKVTAGNYGFDIGRSDVSSADVDCLGEVVVSNGAHVTVTGLGAISRGTCNSSVIPIYSSQGTIVGNWMVNAPVSPTVSSRPVVGRIVVTGKDSYWQNLYGHVFVGTGKAEGSVALNGGCFYVQHNQDGFSDSSNSNSSKDTASKDRVYFKVYATNSVMVVGAFGGKGTVEITDGLFTNNVRTFVGGIHTNDFFDGEYFKYGSSQHLLAAHDAEGTLRVTGGTFSATKCVILGADGSGTLEIGPTGIMTAPEVVLSNQTVSVARFVFDGTSGFKGGLFVDRLTVSAGAKLTVNVGDYPKRHRVTFISARTVAGDFAPENVEVVGGALAARSVVRRTDAGYAIWVGGEQGTTIILR